MVQHNNLYHYSATGVENNPIDIKKLMPMMEGAYNLSEELIKLRINKNNMANVSSDLKPLIVSGLLLTIIESSLALEQLGQVDAQKAIRQEDNLIGNYDLNNISYLLKNLSLLLSNSRLLP